ncbi:hypothetical protein GGR54DRAFT_600051 [Hypoxylon sp. NC1633]|nr:hypothetical protein GGR54DRAFT_600051 [Hypoxylon sp. NC1633]
MTQDNGDKAMPKDLKGKGVDRDSAPSSLTGHAGHTESGKPSPDITSIISRLGASTSRLANDMILRHPSGTSVAEQPASGKAGSSRVTQSVSVGEASVYRNGPQRIASDGMFESTLEQQQHAQGDADFSAFLNNTAGMLQTTEPGGIERSNNDHDFELRQSLQMAAVVPADGVDLVKFLDSAYDGIEETDITLTDHDRTALRRRLFDSDETGEPRPGRGQWEHTLNFFPKAESNSNGIHQYADLLGISDLEDATDIWVDQWQHVLSSYADEVWGDLSPLISVAREELGSLSKPLEEASPSKLKSLRRLQQILVQIRGT